MNTIRRATVAVLAALLLATPAAGNDTVDLDGSTTAAFDGPNRRPWSMYPRCYGVAAASIEELDQVLDDIGLIDGVERTTSSIILSTRIRR